MPEHDNFEKYVDLEADVCSHVSADTASTTAPRSPQLTSASSLRSSPGATSLAAAASDTAWFHVRPTTSTSTRVLPSRDHDEVVAGGGVCPVDGTARLTRCECWALLREAGLGRLGVATPDGGVDIVPVIFITDHGSLLFRSAPGTELDLITAAASVAFEADHVDTETGIAWNVVAHGPATALTRRSDIVATFGLEVGSLPGESQPIFVRLVPESLNGRSYTMARSISPEPIG